MLPVLGAAGTPLLRYSYIQFKKNKDLYHNTTKSALMPTVVPLFNTLAARVEGILYCLKVLVYYQGAQTIMKDNGVCMLVVHLLLYRAFQSFKELGNFHGARRIVLPGDIRLFKYREQLRKELFVNKQ